MEQQPLTLLQRAVLQRLREAGFAALADMARDHWRQGIEVPVPASMAPGEPHGELRADFARANKQTQARH